MGFLHIYIDFCCKCILIKFKFVIASPIGLENHHSGKNNIFGDLIVLTLPNLRFHTIRNPSHQTLECTTLTKGPSINDGHILRDTCRKQMMLCVEPENGMLEDEGAIAPNPS